jgi:hypothetical protein
MSKDKCRIILKYILESQGVEWIKQSVCKIHWVFQEHVDGHQDYVDAEKSLTR